MRKVRIFTLIFLFIVTVTIWYIYKNNRTINYSCTTCGLVAEKEVINRKDYYIFLKVLSSEKTTETVKILVEDENIWNLIEINRTYFIVYDIIKGVTKLVQIEINDDWGKIHKDILFP